MITNATFTEAMRQGPVVFISDLHLDREPDHLLEHCLALLNSAPLQQARALCILGDLFEYWIGDDDHSVTSQRLAQALRRLPIPVIFQHGNRDFLLGAQYAADCGMLVAPEELVAQGPCGPFLMLHGDHLCTADTDHMAFRAKVRQPAWQQDFLARPLPERIAEANRLRAASRAAQQQKSATITDVHPDAVIKALQHHGVRLMIHGHTHRPALHLDEHHRYQRCVLPAWDHTPGYLWLDQHGPRLYDLNHQAYHINKY